jgi:hypothetical protein
MLALLQFFKSSRDEKVGTTQAGLPAGRQASFQNFRMRSQLNGMGSPHWDQKLNLKKGLGLLSSIRHQRFPL